MYIKIAADQAKSRKNITSQCITKGRFKCTTGYF